MLNLWLVPLVVLCGINPEGDAGGSSPLRAHSEAAARWGQALPITGRTQRSDAPDAPLYVALTFDDGPSETVTPPILDALDDYEVTATFFAVGWRFKGRGRRARAQAEVLRETVRRGHAIGNHTVNHRDLRALSPRDARRQIDENEALLNRELGWRPHLFRAPYGALTGPLRAYLAARDYTEVRWNVDSHDYLPRKAAALPDRVLADLIERGGGVVLLHDTKPWTARVLPALLARLEAENCRRRGTGERLLVPVSLDFFMRDADGAHRVVPDAARAAETRYLDRLARVCGTH